MALDVFLAKGTESRPVQEYIPPAQPVITSKKKRGLASASPETRKRVAEKGGMAAHTSRGLQSADAETRVRVAKSGGIERAKDKEGLREAGRRGGQKLKQLYGKDHFVEIGKKGRNSPKRHAKR